MPYHLATPQCRLRLILSESDGGVIPRSRTSRGGSVILSREACPERGEGTAKELMLRNLTSFAALAASRLRRLRMTLRTEELPSLVHPIRGAPRVLVLLRATEEIEGRGAVADGLLDGVRHDDGSDAQFFELGIVAAQVVVDRVAEGESVENGDDPFGEAG